MSITALSSQLRLALEDPADKVSREQILTAVNEFVVVCASSEESCAQLLQAEEDLQSVYNDVVDHRSLGHTEVFLDVLHHLSPLLSSTSIISTWFDLVLRPALREPRLPTISMAHTKDLIVFAATNEDPRHPEKIHEFRKRLVDHLLDAYNESYDILEWVKLDQKERERRDLWKRNLEDVLVKFGLKSPLAFLTQAKVAFASSASRLHLLILLDCFTSEPEFQANAADFARHPLMDSLLNSLLLDDAPIACTIGLTILVKLLPIFAVKAYEELKIILSQLFVILARIICREDISGSILPCPALLNENNQHFGLGRQAEEYEELTALELRPEMSWERLQLPLDPPSAPPLDAYFSSLYYLFPCNLLRFLRSPPAYLRDRNYKSPYFMNWEDVLDEDKIRSKSEPLLRSRVVNPRVVWMDWLRELTERDVWVNHSIPQIASECAMLELRHITLGSQFSSAAATDTARDLQRVMLSDVMTPEDVSGIPTPHPGHTSLPLVKPRVSLQDMITASVALKSDLEIDTDNLSTPWPTLLFSSSSSPTKASPELPPESVGQNTGALLPSHVTEAISSLQREVLLLRCEFNFQLWLSRQNVRHIGRLHRDHVLSKNTEADRQALHNKLRQYRAQVQSLEQQLREHKEQSSSAKNKYADWNTELQKKLREFREEKKSWVSEAAVLRTAEKEARALFVAQGKLLADAEKAVFELQTQHKENQHKIDRLHDYERQIEQHVRIQKLWDSDFQKFNARGEEMEHMKGKYKQMEMLLESHVKSHDKLEDETRACRRQNQALEAKLVLMHKRCEASRRIPETEIAAIVAEKSELAAANARLREDNAELKDEMDEMRAALEGLKAQLSGQRGLIYESRQRAGTTVQQ